MVKKLLENILKNTRSNFIRENILKILYWQKGLQFKGLQQIENRFYIFHINNFYLPAELPYWNVVYTQYDWYCRQYSLSFCKLQPGNIVIDIGAGLGEEMVVFAEQVTTTGKVVSVEALPQAFAVLQETARLNNYTQVNCVQAALYHNNAAITLVDDDGSYDAIYIGDDSSKNVHSATGITFNKIAELVPNTIIDLLKVNIEGAERYLLNDAFIPDFERIKCIAIACHDFRYKNSGNIFFKTKEDVLFFFNNAGFEVFYKNTGKGNADDWVYGFNKKLVSDNNIQQIQAEASREGFTTIKPFKNI